jgi:hypothetical protein
LQPLWIRFTTICKIILGRKGRILSIEMEDTSNPFWITFELENATSQKVEKDYSLTSLDMPAKLVAREAAFYSIDIPFLQKVENLQMLDDEIIHTLMYSSIRETSDEILEIVSRQFKDRATKGHSVKSGSFVANNQASLEEILTQVSAEPSYPLMNLNSIYSEESTIINNKYHQLLVSTATRKAIIYECSLHNLTVKIEEVDSLILS